jgi:hypothetical protein
VVQGRCPKRWSSSDRDRASRPRHQSPGPCDGGEVLAPSQSVVQTGEPLMAVLSPPSAGDASVLASLGSFIEVDAGFAPCARSARRGMSSAVRCAKPGLRAALTPFIRRP